MAMMGPDHDRACDPLGGLSARRERRWGALGGTLGAAFGVGAALIAVLVEGSPLVPSGAYPEFFAERRLLAFDLYLLASLVAGLGFLVAALVQVRVGRYPRTDGFGAGLTGAILTVACGSLLFLRLYAVARGG
jgi:hypothetical protein